MKTKIIILAVLVILMIPVIATAKVHSKYYADLDKDGKNEIIQVINYKYDEFDCQTYQLLVKDSKGRKIWKSGKSDYKTGGLGFSMELPEVIGDVTGNGDIEMIVQGQRSDVSPSYFEVYRWQNNRFQKLGKGALKASLNNPVNFKWTDNDIIDCSSIESFSKITNPGNVVANVLYINGSSIKRWTGKFKATEKGFRLVKRLHSESNLNNSSSNTYSSSNNNSNSYTARLSQKDHYNSRGVRLRSISDIIRQDRANYHKKRTNDSEDAWDGYFGTLKAREKMSRMKINVYGGKNAIKAIKNGTPLINVEVSGNSLNVRIVSY